MFIQQKQTIQVQILLKGAYQQALTIVAFLYSLDMQNDYLILNKQSILYNQIHSLPKFAVRLKKIRQMSQIRIDSSFQYFYELSDQMALYLRNSDDLMQILLPKQTKKERIKWQKKLSLIKGLQFFSVEYENEDNNTYINITQSSSNHRFIFPIQQTVDSVTQRQRVLFIFIDYQKIRTLGLENSQKAIMFTKQSQIELKVLNFSLSLSTMIMNPYRNHKKPNDLGLMKYYSCKF
ncbi:hypothetical protein pb186bvf_003141 [Paramecium bursaria]